MITDLVYCNLIRSSVLSLLNHVLHGIYFLHKILKNKLNNLHVLIILHVVCFYFACNNSILGKAVGSSQYYASPVQCRGLRKFGGMKFAQFQGGMRIYGGLATFQDPGEWSMSVVGQ